MSAGRQHPACQVAESIWRTAREFAGDAPQDDDMTAVCVKVETIDPVTGAAS